MNIKIYNIQQCDNDKTLKPMENMVFLYEFHDTTISGVTYTVYVAPDIVAS